MLLGIIIAASYGAFLLVLQRLSGVDYDLIADSASNLFQFVTVPVLVGSVVLSLVWWRSGWGRSVFFDDPALRVGGVFWLPVVLVVAQIALGLTQASWSDLAMSFLLAGLVGTMAVGFSEELLTRGLLLDAVRRSSSEAQAFLASTVTFGLLHGMNIINGQGVGLTLQQVLFTMVSGVSFYATRRATGSLLASMILHCLFDFQIIMQGDIHLKPEGDVTDIAGTAIISAVLLYAEMITAVIITVKVLRGRDLSTAAVAPGSVT